MAGSSKQAAAQQPTSQTVTQTNLPEYIRPYVESTARRAEGISNRPYEAYPGPRIAGFNGDQSQSFDMARGLGSTYQPMFQQGTAASGQAQQGFQQAGQYSPTNFNVDQVGSQDWNAGIAANYMNPYLTNVLQQQNALSTERFTQDQRGRDLARVNAGSFGGYRHGIANEVARDQFNRGIDLNNATALNQGYNTAYSNFAQDRASGLQAGISNQNANLEGQRMGEQSRQFGANLGLQGAQGLAGIGDQLYRQGSLARDYAGRDLDVLRSSGQQQQDQQQRNLDLGYTDFVNQRDYEKNQLNYLNSIIRGLPITSNSDTMTYATENPYSNLIGAGIGATGLINAVGGISGAAR